MISEAEVSLVSPDLSPLRQLVNLICNRLAGALSASNS